MYVLGAQKNPLIETVLFSTHNIRIGRDIRKIFFDYTLLSSGLGLNYFNHDNLVYLLKSLFSSPELKAVIGLVPLSSVKFFFKWHLILNH